MHHVMLWLITTVQPCMLGIQICHEKTISALLFVLLGSNSWPASNFSWFQLSRKKSLGQVLTLKNNKSSKRKEGGIDISVIVSAEMRPAKAEASHWLPADYGHRAPGWAESYWTAGGVGSVSAWQQRKRGHRWEPEGCTDRSMGVVTWPTAPSSPKPYVPKTLHASHLSLKQR